MKKIKAISIFCGIFLFLLSACDTSLYGFSLPNNDLSDHSVQSDDNQVTPEDDNPGDDEKPILETTPYINSDGFWVINDVVTQFTVASGLPALDSEGYWMIGQNKTSFLAYTTTCEPMKSIKYFVESINGDLIDTFVMSDGSIRRNKATRAAFDSIKFEFDSISKQEYINSIPNIVISICRNGIVIERFILPHYCITNIENINFSVIGEYKISFYYCGKIENMFLNIVENKIELSGNNEYDFHTELQSSFLKSDRLDIENYCKGDTELSKPVPYILSFSADIKENSKISLFELNFHYFEYEFNYNLDIAKLFNLEIQKQYILFSVVDGLLSCVLKVEVVSDICRNLDIGGVTNCRDIGGKRNIDGAAIAQNLFFRTAALNKSYTSQLELLVDERGLFSLGDGFGIKTEVDLRLNQGERGKYTESVIPNASYCPYLMDSGLNLPEINNNEKIIKDIFENTLSNIENYPMIIHCSIGTDRTGLISFLLLGVLGCEDEIIYKDYLFSNFGLINAERTINGIKISFTNYLNRFNGETLREKIVNYLLEIGVSYVSLQKINDIFYG